MFVFSFVLTTVLNHCGKSQWYGAQIHIRGGFAKIHSAGHLFLRGQGAGLFGVPVFVLFWSLRAHFPFLIRPQRRLNHPRLAKANRSRLRFRFTSNTRFCCKIFVLQRIQRIVTLIVHVEMHRLPGMSWVFMGALAMRVRCISCPPPLS